MIVTNATTSAEATAVKERLKARQMKRREEAKQNEEDMELERMFCSRRRIEPTVVIVERKRDIVPEKQKSIGTLTAILIMFAMIVGNVVAIVYGQLPIAIGFAMIAMAIALVGGLA